MSHYDKDWKGLNKKIKLSRKESEDSFAQIRRTIHDPKISSKQPAKQWISFAAVALLITILALSNINGVGEKDTANDTLSEQVAEDIMISITNQTNLDFHGISLNVYKGEQKVDNQNMINADNSLIAKGQKVHFDFIEEDFELNGEIAIEAVIVFDNENRVTIEPVIPLTIERGKEYKFKIVGNSIETTRLEPVD
ncbi:hypothetical protein SAMN04487944_107101 [Gracilibacillus ureilyticus]|uniref:Uncharacterized protein n=1 Tax=Gracilibacillus ureilyticus TaxID=531814 RepID=A0A1H9QTF3_9BACI|nr:hypothetical protein [Gracilibacillus ureilyticus]SER63891.1 hypothetical protein SAMN04487944_107101 [Gracilibacillus ureilyticus]